MKDKLDSLMSKFNTQPIFFIGSGLSRRYLDIEDWAGLLDHHAQMVTGDEFAFRMYENKAKSVGYKEGILPKIGDLIETDFNEKWFKDLKFRSSHNQYETRVKSGISPFKAEIAMFAESKSKEGYVKEYIEEIELLKKVSEKSVSAIITTNYDNLLESIFCGYDRYIGQEELIFSTISGVGEIYKIHGCSSKPESIVLIRS